MGEGEAMTGMEVALVVGLVGAAMSAVGAIMSANAQASAMEHEAEIAERNARIVEEQAGNAADRERRLGRKRLGSVTTGYAASGVRLGTTTDVMQDLAIENELEAQLMEYSGELRALGFNDAATIHRMNASRARQEGLGAAAGALVKGIGSAAGGMGGGGANPFAGATFDATNVSAGF